MTNIYRLFRVTARSMVALMYLLFTPLGSGAVARAQEAVPPPATATETTGETSPAVEAPPDYVYNEATGRWENGIYAWDPVTNQTTPLTQQNYSYNPETDRWETEEWVYDEASQNYVPPPQTAPSAPAESTPALNDPEDPATGTARIAPATVPADEDPANETFFDNFYDASISVTINSTATSGDAQVLGNLQAGSATSGDAQAVASILNMLQSSWNGGSAPTVYNATLQGGYVGDLVIDPTIGFGVSSNPSTASLTVNNSESAAISNDVTLSAASGDATVSGNTLADDATSGDAYAVATLMNLINSSISTQESFIAVLNVLGDMEGDVLLAEELQEQLAAAHVPSSQVTIDNDIQTIISNDIETQATSGSATVSHNTSAGSAASGDAETAVTVYNLTGQSFVAENAILVFVNVMGEWIGFITGAPAGSSSAMLAGGGASLASSGIDDVEINNEASYLIDNDVVVTAASGDATVSGNTEAGDATSGDAYAAVSALNMVNSSISLGGWFSILFINIFGDFCGSIFTDTACGGFSTRSNIPPTSGGTGGDSPGGTGTSSIPSSPRVIVASASGSSGGTFRQISGASRGSTAAAVTEDDQDDTQEVLGAATNTLSMESTASTDEAVAAGSPAALMWTAFAAAAALLLILRFRRGHAVVPEV